MASLVYPGDSAVAAAVAKFESVDEAAASLIRKFQPSSEATKANIEEWRDGVKKLCETAKVKQDGANKPQQSSGGDNKPNKLAKPEASKPEAAPGGASGS